MTALSFMSLPAEVRNHIYDYLFAGAIIEDHGFSPKPIRVKNYHLSITLANQQIRAESLSVLQNATTLHFRIGQAGTPPIPARILRDIRNVRIPAHRLQTLDLWSFADLKKLILDVSIDPSLWKVLQQAQTKYTSSLTNISDMIHLSMTLGFFEHSRDVEKVWRDETRTFKILCWISSWVRDKAPADPVLIDLDRGIILAN